MREGRPSTTAQGVALLRAIASLPSSPFPDVDDPLAGQLLDGPFRWMFEAVRRERRAAPWLRLSSSGLLDHVALRTATIDDAVRFAASRGAVQLVVLGAGLDARAFRMRELESVTVFEVDFPATQARKREHLRGRPPVAREVRFVSIDFEHESLHEKLALVGHDPELETVWIWEGVTPYLAPDATSSTLDVIGRRSAFNSTLIVSYVTPELVRLALGRTSRSLPVLMRSPLRALFSTVGEPIRGTIDSVALSDLIASRGFSLHADSGSRQWAEAHPVRGGLSRVEITERVAVAVRTSVDRRPLE